MLSEGAVPKRIKKYKKAEHFPSCFELYMQSGKYKMVYRRSKKVEEEQYFNEDFGCTCWFIKIGKLGCPTCAVIMGLTTPF